MSEQLQLRRGTATQVTAFTGAQGETVVDTTNNRLVVQDGATAGGWAAAKLTEVLTNTRKTVLDAAYTALTTDRLIAYTALTAARTVSLPAASTYPTGTTLTVVDESGSASGSEPITIAASGTDTINIAASAVITSAYGYIALESNGSNKWTIIDQAASSLSAVGIGTAADPNNPLSVTANAVLFNQSSSGASPGNIRVNLSKASSTSTASFIFQDNFSERAEIGLTGDDNFHFKVSPNGSTFNTGILIDATTGAVTLGNARTPVSDAAYSALPTDRTIAFTAITAARAVSLPAASAFPAGVTLTVMDESGSCSPTNSITLVANGSDTIDGVGSLVISRTYGFASLESNGSNQWTMVEQAGALAVLHSGSVNSSSSGSGAFINMTPSFTLPPNFLQNGKAVRISAAFRITSGSAPPTLSIQLKAGSTVIASIGEGTPTASLTNVQFGLTFILQAIAAPGASSNCECCLFGNSNTSAPSATTMPVALATNAAITLQMATEWSAAGTGTNTVTLSQFIVEALN